ncbi:MAG: hypothetical protein JWO69_322 [Thermoleophilia bacterium]|jgi:hypothetical protein|nr:hypothetical protein [Thermoleophilia bacterium]
MQLTATTPNTRPAPDFAGDTLGTIHRSGFDWQLANVPHPHIGDWSGYASVDDATRAASELSKEYGSSMAVLAHEDRFFVNATRYLTMIDDFFDGRLYSGIGQHKEHGFTFTNQAMRALVEGSTVIHAGKSGEKVAFPSPS